MADVVSFDRAFGFEGLQSHQSGEGREQAAEPRESHAFCTRFYSVFGSVAGSLRMAQQQLPDAVRLPRLPHMHSADSS